MTLTQIKYFVDVAECRSFTRAAQRNYVVQQVISKQIGRLEKELGYPLFTRVGKTPELTEAGKLLYEFWDRMLQEQADALHRAHNLVETQDRAIRIGSFPISPIYDLIAEAISMAGQRDPGWKYLVEQGSYRELCRRLVAGELDCIISMEEENRILPGEYESVNLIPFKPALVISRRHPLYHANVTTEELKDTTYYILSAKFSTNAEGRILNHCSYFGFVPEKIQYFDDVTSMEMALYAGNGVSLIYPEFFRNPFGKLAALPIPDELAEVNYVTAAFHPKMRERLKLFVSCLKEVCREESIEDFWGTK